MNTKHQYPPCWSVWTRMTLIVAIGTWLHTLSMGVVRADVISSGDAGDTMGQATLIDVGDSGYGDVDVEIDDPADWYYVQIYEEDDFIGTRFELWDAYSQNKPHLSVYDSEGLLPFSQQANPTAEFEVGLGIHY